MAKKPETRAIDAFRKVFRNKRRVVEVPEVGITLYFPALTTAAKIAVAEHMGEKPPETPKEAWEQEVRIVLLIHQAELEDGTKAFAFGDKSYLLEQVDYLLMQRLLGEMYAAGLPDMPKDVEEGKGDSGKTENSASA